MKEKKLIVLSLDGLGSASGCTDEKKIPFSHVIYNYKKISGNIPNCIWTEMKNLTVLSLSGNGLKGTIGEIDTITTTTSSSSSRTTTTTTPSSTYMYVWDGTCEGGIFPSGQKLPKNFDSSKCLMINVPVYNRIEFSIKVILKYKETIRQLESQFYNNNNNNISSNGSQIQSIKSILTTLNQSLTKLIAEREKIQANITESQSNSDSQLNRYLPGGYGIFMIPSNCINQLNAISSLQPGTWIRARKMLCGAFEEIQHTKRNEIISAKLTNVSSINVLPPFQFDILYLGKNYEQFRKTYLSTHSIPQSLPRKLYSSNGQPYTPLALVLATPAPAKFLSLVKIISFFPNSFDNFVIDHSTGFVPIKNVSSSENSTHSDLNLTYMFSIRIHDDTAYADAIIFGLEGETFFQGVTANQFYSDQRIRLDLQTYLEKVIEEGIIFEFNLITYLTPASSVDDSSRPKVKRIAIINSSILPQIERKIK